MQSIKEASCSCGQLSARVEGDPVRISVCHCLACQKRTGSTFGVQVRYPRERVQVTGPFSEYMRVADSGNRIRFQFCPTCASIICYHLEGLEGFVGIPVGVFADPAFPPPGVSVYEERKHAWVGLPVEIEHIN